MPVASQGVLAFDRFAYVNNNPLRYNDPMGHSVDCAVGEQGCRAGELPPSSLMHIYEHCRGNGNPANKYWGDYRDALILDVDNYLRRHPEYREWDDRRLSLSDGYAYNGLRNSYWIERTSDPVEANLLRNYYDYGWSNQTTLNTANMSWGDIGLDLIDIGTSIIGLPSVADSTKLGKSEVAIANVVNQGLGTYQTADSVVRGDIPGTIANIMGFVPGPAGVVGSFGSLILDIFRGTSVVPYTPSIPR